MTSNHHAPYDLGYTRATMDRTKGSETSEVKPILQICSQVRIAVCNLDCVKLESLVIVDQHAAVNTFPGLVHTARHNRESL